MLPSHPTERSHHRFQTRRQLDALRDTSLDAGEGRLLLCPSDPPLCWIKALEVATPEVGSGSIQWDKDEGRTLVGIHCE